MSESEQTEGGENSEDEDRNRSIKITISPEEAAVETHSIPNELKPLKSINSIYVKLDRGEFEIEIHEEMASRYHILNNRGARIYYAGEKSGYSKCCEMSILGSNRPFVMNLFNAQGTPVIKITRPCTCSMATWGADVAGSRIEVRSATGEFFGSVIQKFNCFTASFKVLDADNKTIMTIRGSQCAILFSGCHCSDCGTEFSIYVTREQARLMNILNEHHSKEDPVMIGCITKKLEPREFKSDRTHFGMIIEPSLDPRMKAVLMGATFCIDFSYYENTCLGGLSVYMFLYVVVVITCFVLYFLYFR